MRIIGNNAYNGIYFRVFLIFFMNLKTKPAKTFDILSKQFLPQVSKTLNFGFLQKTRIDIKILKDFINEKYNGAVIPYEPSEDAEAGTEETTEAASEEATEAVETETEAQ